MESLRFRLLADHRDAISTLAAWFESEWAPYYGPDGPGDAMTDLRQSCNRNELPIAIVAFSGCEIVGTAALKHESVTTHKHLSPWLAALLVHPKHRRQGIAQALIKEIEKLAKTLAFEEIYIGIGEGSGTPRSAVKNRGWHYLESTPYFVSVTHVFVKTLACVGSA